MKRTVSQTALILAAFAALAAIWAPGDWWQWLLTAFLLVIVGAATSETP